MPIRHGVTAMHLYCFDCNEAHRFTLPDVERIVYCLQGDLLDMIHDGRAGGDTAKHRSDTETDCLQSVLTASRDGEMFKEWTDGAVEARVAVQPVDCPRHDDEPGLHHATLCHYFDDDPDLVPGGREAR